MAHVRIRCRIPQPAANMIAGVTAKGTSGFPMINGLVASWHDVECFIVEDDGSERPWSGVKSVEWSAREGTDACTAKVELYNVELDVMAEAEIEPLAARILDIVECGDTWSKQDADPTPEQRAALVRRIAAVLQGKIGVAE